MRRLALPAALAVVALVTAGCLLPLASGDEAGAGTADPAAPTARRDPTQSATGQSLEGQFTFATMDRYVDAITPMITDWIDDTWQAMPYPQAVRYVPRGATGMSDCIDSSGRAARFDSSAYAYCGADQTIYVGQDMLWLFYTNTGDAGPAVGLAHEWGHHIQQRVGVPGARTAAESVRLENQADCLAGAWTRYTDERGWLEYPDDIEDIEALFPLIGSAEGTGRDHGTTAERFRSFTRGFEGGAGACNDFFPATPVLSE